MRSPIDPFNPFEAFEPFDPFDPFTSAVELAAAIRRKEVSPVEVADCCRADGGPTRPRLARSAGAGRAPAAASDPAVQRFVDAGLILLGRPPPPSSVPCPSPRTTPSASRATRGTRIARRRIVDEEQALRRRRDGTDRARRRRRVDPHPRVVQQLFLGLKPTPAWSPTQTVSVEGLGAGGVLTRTVADTRGRPRCAGAP